MKVEIVDTNVILRYLLADVDELYIQVEKVIAETINGKRKFLSFKIVFHEVCLVK